MTFKTVATILTAGDAADRSAVQAAPLLSAAATLARAEGAHLDVVALGIDRSMPQHYYAGTSAMIIQENHVQAEAEAVALADLVRARLDGAEVPWWVEAMTAQMATISPFVGQALRCADVAVLARPYGPGRDEADPAIVEAALFSADLPVLIAPAAGLPSRFSRILVAWNESPEALRAVRAALPLIARADITDIAIVDPPRHAPDRSDPGGDLCRMLARHGARAEVSVLARTVPRVADVLERHLRDTGADLLVMGAYGHSRFREAVLGGATRHMLEQAAAPVLMKH
jgi:nucleotide-binding universal stress UspA family protein